LGSSSRTTAQVSACSINVHCRQPQMPSPGHGDSRPVGARPNGSRKIHRNSQ
jgi:hypothetical protein